MPIAPSEKVDVDLDAPRLFDAAEIRDRLFDLEMVRSSVEPDVEPAASKVRQWCCAGPSGSLAKKKR